MRSWNKHKRQTKLTDNDIDLLRTHFKEVKVTSSNMGIFDEKRVFKRQNLIIPENKHEPEIEVPPGCCCTIL